MLLLSRKKLNPNPGYTPSRLTESYVAGRPPLTLVTHQNPFHAAAAQTVETESPQPETFSRDIQDAPIPPRPRSFPQLSPRNSGPRRPPARADTEETLSPSPESLSQSQLPNIIPMPRPYPAPIRSRTLASGEDLGEFARNPPYRHWSGHEYSYEYTAGNSYWSDTASSPPSDPGPSHYRPADISGGPHARVWPIYNKISEKYDKKLSTKWNDDLDVLLIFAALFSAITTTFLITSLSNLQPNYQQQSALLLYQLLNGRDPSLANLSDPTAIFRPSGSAIAVNCLWFASLSMSLGTSFGAMVCKQWQTEYNNGADPIVDLLRACRRQIHLMTFLGWNIHATALLPPLLQLSVLLFFTGAVIFLWQVDTTVTMVYASLGIMFSITYLIILPVVTKTPFRPYSTLLIHRLSVAIGKLVVPAVDFIAHGGFLVLRYVTRAILWPLAQAILSAGTLHNWCKPILPGEYTHMGVWWENAFDDSLDQINTSPRIQEEAILWLSQMPLNTSQSEDVVSSLALISSSRPHKFPKSVAVFLNSALESSCREAPSRARMDCVLVLGRIKYQSVVDQNRDEDHVVGDIPVTALVAYAAQQLTISAFEEKSNTPHSEGMRARLLAAAAWLSPVDAVEGVTPEGERFPIQGRQEFVKQVGITLMLCFRSENPLDNGVLVDLIHGMHASIPRGNYGTQASILPFPLLTYEDYRSPWSKDESVLRALITYALDLLSPPERRKPLVDRKIKFGELALELIDTLMVPMAPAAEVVVFGFWLIHRVPYAFKLQKSTLADIILTWTLSLTNEAILEDHRKQLNFHAVNAFVAVARRHLIAKGKLPKFGVGDVLNLLKASLEDSRGRPVVAYALALIFNFGTSKQATTLSAEMDIGSFANIFHTVRSDLEANATEEDVLNLYIHTALLLSKLEQPPVDIERVKAVVEEVKKTIGDVVVGLDPVSAKGFEDEMDVDIDRVRWKAIYLSGLLVKFLPAGEREGHIEGLRGRVQKVLQTGQLPLATDYKRCLEPLGVGSFEFPAEREGARFTAFEAWVNGFPLFPLAGSVLSKA